MPRSLLKFLYVGKCPSQVRKLILGRAYLKGAALRLGGSWKDWKVNKAELWHPKNILVALTKGQLRVSTFGCAEAW